MDTLDLITEENFNLEWENEKLKKRLDSIEGKYLEERFQKAQLQDEIDRLNRLNDMQGRISIQAYNKGYRDGNNRRKSLCPNWIA